MFEALDYESHPQERLPNKWGHVYVFCFRNEMPQITIGPNWGLSIVLIAITLGLCFLFSRILIGSTFSTGWKVAGMIIVLFELICLFYAIFANPGIPEPQPREAVKTPGEWCNICELPRYKTAKTYHCRICDLCCEEWDHHCPWFGKCIGRGNIVCFHGFLAFFLVLLFAIILTAAASASSVASA